MNSSIAARFALIWAGVITLACGGDASGPSEVCTDWGEWSTSSYVLPYSAPNAYAVIQGQCSRPGNGHRGANRYSYDFGTAINTPFVAARAGTVVYLVESHVDGEVAPTGFDNYILVLHADGSTALYGHLTNNGAVVDVGSEVAQGQLLGYTGNTGNTANIPHLHFSVQGCNPVTLGSARCVTIPSNFRNTDPNPTGLEEGRVYTAQ